MRVNEDEVFCAAMALHLVEEVRAMIGLAPEGAIDAAMAWLYEAERATLTALAGLDLGTWTYVKAGGKMAAALGKMGCKVSEVKPGWVAPDGSRIVRVGQAWTAYDAKGYQLASGAQCPPTTVLMALVFESRMARGGE